MNVSKSMAAFFVLLVLFSGNYSMNAQNRSIPDIRGVIRNLIRFDSVTQSNKLLGSILVEREANAVGNIDKTEIKIIDVTRIYAQADRDKHTPLNTDSLELNQHIEVRFTPNPALLTYPIQVGAAEIIILSGLTDSKQNSSSMLTDTLPQIAQSEMIKVRRAIDTINALWVDAWAKGDARLLPATFIPDGVELLPGSKIYKGRKQILDLIRDVMQKRGGRAKLKVTTTDVWLDGNTAYETGTSVYEFTTENQPQRLERRYFTVWKRQTKRGAWKIYSNVGAAK